MPLLRSATQTSAVQASSSFRSRSASAERSRPSKRKRTPDNPKERNLVCLVFNEFGVPCREKMLACRSHAHLRKARRRVLSTDSPSQPSQNALLDVWCLRKKFSLESNPDYLALKKVMELLERQKEQTLRDIEELRRIKQEAYDKPVEFVAKLQKKGSIQFPDRQKAAEVPAVKMGKYDVADLRAQLELHRPPAIDDRVPGSPLNDTVLIGPPDASFPADTPPLVMTQGQDQKPNEEADIKTKAEPTTPEPGAVVRGRVFTPFKPVSFNRLWTAEEHERLLKLLDVYPPEQVSAHRWAKIAKALGDRTPKQVASRTQKYFIKLAKAGLPVPGKIPNLEHYTDEARQKRKRQKIEERRRKYGIEDDGDPNGSKADGLCESSGDDESQQGASSSAGAPYNLRTGRSSLSLTDQVDDSDNDMSDDESMSTETGSVAASAVSVGPVPVPDVKDVKVEPIPELKAAAVEVPILARKPDLKTMMRRRRSRARVGASAAAAAAARTRAKAAGSVIAAAAAVVPSADADGSKALDRLDSDLVLHYGYQCDGCGIEPIVGPRWKCLECPEENEVDLCQECVTLAGNLETDLHRPEHRLECVERAESRPYYLNEEYDIVASYLDPTYLAA